MAYQYFKRDFKKSLTFINGTPYRTESIYNITPVVFDGNDYTFSVNFLNGSVRRLFFKTKEEAIHAHKKLEGLL